MEEHLAGLGHQEDSFILAISEFLSVDAHRIAVAQADLPAFGRRNQAGDSDFGPAILHAILERADAAHHGGVHAGDAGGW